MINNDRIVPIQKIDYLSMIGTVLNLIGTSYTILEADNVEGDFTVNGTTGTMLANQPAKSITFTVGLPGLGNVVYFVPAYDFAGLIDGDSGNVVSGSENIQPDGVTLYRATGTHSSSMTIEAITPMASAD
jgi:hypothetical protein